MSQPMTLLARHNVAALHAVAQLLKGRGNWTARREIGLDVDEALFHQFHSLAWADRKLHHGECRLIDAVLEEDRVDGAHLQLAIASGAIGGSLPGFLAAAALHDSVHGTGFANVILNHLENLGRLTMMADAEGSGDEREAYQWHFWQMRNGIAEPGTGLA